MSVEEDFALIVQELQRLERDAWEFLQGGEKGGRFWHSLLMTRSGHSERQSRYRCCETDKRLPFWLAIILADGGTFAVIGVPSMCDYSLHLVASRPARVGDKLISTSFPHTSTRGFASVDDRNMAVCLLPGTELVFEKEIRCETGMVFSWRLGHRVAKFRHVNKGQSNVHHDALEFPDGKTVLLTHLCKGQRATVLQLPARAGVTVDEAQPHDSTVVSPVVAGLVARADWHGF
jgi:hypothetical protein